MSGSCAYHRSILASLILTVLGLRVYYIFIEREIGTGDCFLQGRLIRKGQTKFGAESALGTLQELRYEDSLLRNLGYSSLLDTQGTQYGVFPASFWFVKVPKVGGSTLAGIFRAIAAHYGIHMCNPLEGEFMLDDARLEKVFSTLADLDFKYFGIANHMMYHNITAPTHFLKFTAVRHPVDRALSHYYFDCTQTKDVDSCGNDEEGLLKFLASVEKNLQVTYLGGQRMADVKNFNFVFVTDRMDESLVAFKIVFGLQWKDIAYLPAKVLHDKYKTFADMPDAMATKVFEILSPRIEHDLSFYSHASMELNNTISQIDSLYGPGTFLAHVEYFRQLLAKVDDTCRPTELAQVENRWMDNGIHFRCVDSVTSA